MGFVRTGAGTLNLKKLRPGTPEETAAAVAELREEVLYWTNKPGRLDAPAHRRLDALYAALEKLEGTKVES